MTVGEIGADLGQGASRFRRRYSESFHQRREIRGEAAAEIRRRRNPLLGGLAKQPRQHGKALEKVAQPAVLQVTDIGIVDFRRSRPARPDISERRHRRLAKAELEKILPECKAADKGEMGQKLPLQVDGRPFAQDRRRGAGSGRRIRPRQPQQRQQNFFERQRGFRSQGAIGEGCGHWAGSRAFEPSSQQLCPGWRLGWTACTAQQSFHLLWRQIGRAQAAAQQFAAAENPPPLPSPFSRYPGIVAIRRKTGGAGPLPQRRGPGGNGLDHAADKVRFGHDVALPVPLPAARITHRRKTGKIMLCFCSDAS